MPSQPRKAPRKRYPSDDPRYRRQHAGDGPIGHPQKYTEPRGAAPRTRRKQPPAPSARAVRALPSPVVDFGAFTAPRASSKLPKVPALAELAAQEAPELATVTGGDCPHCHRPHGDDDRHCQFCGTALRRACACGRPLRDDQQFCAACGKPAPAPLELDGEGARVVPLRAVPPEELWDADDLFWVSAAVDGWLIHLDAEILDDADRAKINGRAAAVANKHVRIGGKWKEEIRLGMAIAGAVFPALYIHYVIAPREARKHASSSSASSTGASSSSASSTEAAS